ncbi:MAG: ribosome biogenesis GTP-binding protein YsxC [Oligoflexales bacterium]|nr:ribosome biogenesis GTP-binding protein YsxC [Oligoflexales bacterium]
MNTSYITSAQKANQLPQFEWGEVAFIGRSNCGKSSLLNTLLERKNLARSSSTPGRTQMINFFKVSPQKEQALIFADLPGYGFNVASKDVRKNWDELMGAYVERSSILEFICLLDCRRSPDDFELDYWRFLGEKVPILLVLTKIDKVSQKECSTKTKKVTEVLEANGIAFKGIYPISNLKKTGVKKLRDTLYSHLPQGEE